MSFGGILSEVRWIAYNRLSPGCPPQRWAFRFGAAADLADGVPVGLKIAGFAGEKAGLFAVAATLRHLLASTR
jgi:hypothetical protein